MKIIIFLVIFVQSEAGPMLGLLGTFPTLDACETVLKKIKESDYIVTKLISPAGAEKIASKTEIAALANPVSSGNPIAPMDDKRPAVLPPAALGQALRRL